MRRALTAALLASLLIAAAPTTAHAHGDRWTHCRYKTQYAPYDAWNRIEVKHTILCALSHWPANTSETLYIAQRESGMTALATNAYSGACGTFQSLQSLWPARVTWLRHVTGWHVDPSCWNARTNVLWAVRYQHAYGYGPWSMG